MPLISQQPRVVLFVTFPGMCLLDLTGPHTVFWAASKYLEEHQMGSYERYTVSINGGLVQTVEGLTLDTLPLSQFDGRTIDTIIVPGAPEIEEVLDAACPTVDWIKNAAASARRTASVCTGAFVLARAGLLSGKRVATHWGKLDLLKHHYPSIDVDRDAIFVRQDSIWTSAGVSAGIDLALALVEDDCGRTIAMQVARELVVFIKRQGGQAQFSELLQLQSKDSAVFDDLHTWLSDNFADPSINIDSLAKRARMSARNFSRVYKQKTGRAPGKAVELFRVEAARRLLENSDYNLDQIAGKCGFVDEDRMRVTFLRNLGVTPSEYRKRFGRSCDA